MYLETANGVLRTRAIRVALAAVCALSAKQACYFDAQVELRRGADVVHPCGRTLRQRLALLPHLSHDRTVVEAVTPGAIYQSGRASSENSGGGDLGIPHAADDLALPHAGADVLNIGRERRSAVLDDERGASYLQSGVSGVGLAHLQRGPARYYDVELCIEWGAGSRGGSLRSVWEDPSVTTVRALKNWEHLAGCLTESWRDLRIVWWGAPDHLPAPAFIAVNKQIAVVCFRGEDSSELESAVGAPFAGPHEPAGSGPGDVQLPPSLWAAVENLHCSENEHGDRYTHGGGAWDGVHSKQGPEDWQETGHRRNWGVMPQDFVPCQASRPAGAGTGGDWGHAGVDGSGRAARVAMARANEVSAAMDESKAWCLLKGREVLVVGHGLAGAAAHVFSLQSLDVVSRLMNCRSYYSVALGPCMPADSVLSSMVHGVCGVGEAVVCSCCR